MLNIRKTYKGAQLQEYNFGREAYELDTSPVLPNVPMLLGYRQCRTTKCGYEVNWTPFPGQVSIGHRQNPIRSAARRAKVFGWKNV